jgi:hypothetical protein
LENPGKTVIFAFGADGLKHICDRPNPHLEEYYTDIMTSAASFAFISILTLGIENRNSI